MAGSRYQACLSLHTETFRVSGLFLARVCEGGGSFRRLAARKRRPSCFVMLHAAPGRHSPPAAAEPASRPGRGPWRVGAVASGMTRDLAAWTTRVVQGGDDVTLGHVEAKAPGHPAKL